MNHFTTKYASCLQGVLSGFDRLPLRGTIRRLSFVEGLSAYLPYQKVLLKDFGSFAHRLTERIKAASLTPIKALGRPVIYLPSSATNKEQIAQRLAKEPGITQGPVCVLTCVEPCNAFDIYRNNQTKRLALGQRVRKCLSLYHYQIHPEFGFMHARLPTWFPFGVQICLNGREWLARQMDREGLGDVRQDNCFVHLSDFARAQALMDAPWEAEWTPLLGGVIRTLNPLHAEGFGDFCAGYYGSAHQSEWATDIVFSDAATLRRLYPLLVRHGMTALSSPDVMRFMGRKLAPPGGLAPTFKGEVTSDSKTRAEGVRIKHRVNANWVKAYDKAYHPVGSVFRGEATIHNETEFLVSRPKEGEPNGPERLRPLRRGIQDIQRRAEVSQAINDRYLDALSSAATSPTLEELVCQICSPVLYQGKRVRALHPFEPEDAPLREAVSRGEFALQGLRNRDLRSLLYPQHDALTPEEVRRRAGQVTRKLRLLRAHGLIEQGEHTHTYQVTPQGRQIITALLTARHTPVNQLLPKAA